MKIVIVLISILFASCSIQKNISTNHPRNIQATVTEIIKKGRNRVDFTATSDGTNVIHVRYGFRGLSGTCRSIKVGTKITIHSYYNDKYEEWLPRKISINR